LIRETHDRERSNIANLLEGPVIFATFFCDSIVAALALHAIELQPAHLQSVNS
jgi:hypothetical protein